MQGLIYYIGFILLFSLPQLLGAVIMFFALAKLMIYLDKPKKKK